VKDKSYFPCRGPSVKPQTNGAVLRNSTTDMRSLDMFPGPHPTEQQEQ
jgi:hypothetical protein